MTCHGYSTVKICNWQYASVTSITVKNMVIVFCVCSAESRHLQPAGAAQV